MRGPLALSLTKTFLLLCLGVMVVMPTWKEGQKYSFKELQVMILDGGLLQTPKVQEFLTKYIRTKFPSMNEKQEKNMRGRLMRKIKRKMMPLRLPWYGQEPGYARMLR